MPKAILFISVFFMGVLSHSTQDGLIRPIYVGEEEKNQGQHYSQFAFGPNVYTRDWEAAQLEKFECPIEDVKEADFPYIFQTMYGTRDLTNPQTHEGLIELILNIHNLRVIVQRDPSIIQINYKSKKGELNKMSIGQSTNYSSESGVTKISTSGRIVTEWKELIPKEEFKSIEVSSNVFKGARAEPRFYEWHDFSTSACNMLHYALRDGDLKLVPKKDEAGVEIPNAFVLEQYFPKEEQIATPYPAMPLIRPRINCPLPDGRKIERDALLEALEVSATRRYVRNNRDTQKVYMVSYRQLVEDMFKQLDVKLEIVNPSIEFNMLRALNKEHGKRVTEEPVEYNASRFYCDDFRWYLFHGNMEATVKSLNPLEVLIQPYVPKLVTLPLEN
ncbi:MAG: hypothetical protein R2827_12480 [Bdellovibrionales bacterium]